MKVFSFLLKYRLVVISLLLALWSFVTPSRFQKGGIHEFSDYLILGLIICLSFYYALHLKELILLEKILFSILLSIMVMFSTTLLMYRLLDRIYGPEYEMRLLQTSPRIVANLIFYYSTSYIIMGLLILYNLYRKK
jgi:hypothetical protein